jgi:hypothetical protein
MIAKGRQSARFFTPSGLLYESVAGESGHDDDTPPPILDLDEDDDDFGEEQYYDIFQPKVTTLAARLGYAPDLMGAQRSSIEVSIQDDTTHDLGLFLIYLMLRFLVLVFFNFTAG